MKSHRYQQQLRISRTLHVILCCNINCIVTINAIQVYYHAKPLRMSSLSLLSQQQPSNHRTRCGKNGTFAAIFGRKMYCVSGAMLTILAPREVCLDIDGPHDWFYNQA